MQSGSERGGALYTFFRGVGALAAAAVIGLSQTVDYSVLSDAKLHENMLTDRNQLPGAAVGALVLIALCFLRRAAKRQGAGRRREVGLAVFAAIFGFLSVAAQSLYHFDSFVFLTKGTYQTVLSLLCMAGYAGLYYLAARLLFLLLDGGALQRGAALPAPLPTPGGRFGRFVAAHTTAAATAGILLCWLPWLVAFWPGVVTWDMFTQLKACFGTLPLMDDNPVVSTLLMGGCMRLGLWLGSGDLGAMLYMLLQSFVCAYAFGVSISEMKRLGAARWLCIGAGLFFALLPVWPMYARTGHKDYLFTGVCLLFTVAAARAAGRADGAILPLPMRPRDYVRLFALALATCLLRKNGIAVVLPSVAFAVAFAWRGDRKRRARLVAAFSGALALYAVIELAVLPLCGVEKGSARELYSIPFQQTARTLRDEPDAATAADLQAVSGVLDAEAIAESYVPVLSDPVKATYHADGDAAAMRAYFGAWLRMGARAPTPYFAALLSQNYGYYLFTPRIWYNDSTGPCFWYDWSIIPQDWIEEFGLAMPASLAGARGLLERVAEGAEDVPLIGLLCCNALYAALTWLCGWYLLRRKRGAALLYAVPSLCTMLLCFGMPVNACLRYFLPVVATAPLLLAAAASAGKGKSEGAGEGEEKREKT